MRDGAEELEGSVMSLAGAAGRVREARDGEGEGGKAEHGLTKMGRLYLLPTLLDAGTSESNAPTCSRCDASPAVSRSCRDIVGYD